MLLLTDSLIPNRFEPPPETIRDCFTISKCSGSNFSKHCCKSLGIVIS
jgi:hypothetical protein